MATPELRTKDQADAALQALLDTYKNSGKTKIPTVTEVVDIIKSVSVKDRRVQ